MVKWFLAAVGVVVISITISAAHMHLSSGSPGRTPPDPAGFERNRQIDLQYEPVSLVSLLAAPERYDGHEVQVEGFVTLGFEDHGLHLDDVAYKAGLRRNAIWLAPPRWLGPSEARRLHRHYGTVAGTFDAAEHGHMGLYSGALTDVRRIHPTLTEAGFQRLRLQESRAVMVQTVLSGWFLTLVGWMALAILWIASRRRS